MRWLWSIRISRPALAALACVSALATVVVIHSGLARPPAQTAALTALREQRRLVAQATSAATAPAAAVPAAPTPSPPQSGSTGGSSAVGGTGAGPAPAVGAGGGSGAPTPTAGASASPTTSTTGSTTAAARTPAPDAGLPHVGHVFLITLSTPGYADVFEKQAPAPYLRSLVARGTLLSRFRSLGHGELADELAMISGQAPNSDTGRGCPVFREYPSSASPNAAGEVAGSGCVYPESALTIGDQVTSDGKVWGAYVAGMGATACQHPNSGAATGVTPPGTEPGYDVLHNPFVFFHSVLDDGDCQNDDRDLSKLAQVLSRPARTPRFVYVGADACADADPVPAGPSPAPAPTAPATAAGPTTTAASPTTTATGPTTTATSPTTTATGTATSTATVTTTTGTATPSTYGCPAGQPDGIAAEDAFLKAWVPVIMRSPAYRRNGVLVIAFAGSKPVGHPVTTGALVLSRYRSGRRRIASPYDPYALLHSMEAMLDDTPLAHAARAPSFAHAAL